MEFTAHVKLQQEPALTRQSTQRSLCMCSIAKGGCDHTATTTFQVDFAACTEFSDASTTQIASTGQTSCTYSNEGSIGTGMKGVADLICPFYFKSYS